MELKVLTLQIKNWKCWKCIECKKILENKNECKLQKKQKPCNFESQTRVQESLPSHLSKKKLKTTCHVQKMQTTSNQTQKMTRKKQMIHIRHTTQKIYVKNETNNN